MCPAHQMDTEMKTMQKQTVTSLLCLTLLSACGGGGGGGGDTVTIEKNINGVVSKGVVSSASIDIHKISGGQIDSAVTTTATTNSSGSFTAVIADYAGPIQLTLTGDGTAKIKCDAISGCDSNGDGTLDIAFGTNYTLPSSVTLEGMISALDSSVVEASITPISHIVSRYAQANTLDAATIQRAIDTLEAIFNIADLPTIEPTDITSSSQVQAATDPNALKLGLLNAALMEIASQDYNGDIEAMLNTLSQNFISNSAELLRNNGSEDLGGANDASHITLAEITQAMIDTWNSSLTASSNLGIAINNEIMALNNYANSAAAGTVTATDDNVGVSQSQLESAKDIIRTVNTWTTTFHELQNGHGVFNDEMTLAGDLLTPAVASASAALSAATVAMGRAYGVKLNQDSALQIAGKTITFNEGHILAFDCSGNVTGSINGRYQIIDQTIHIKSPGSVLLIDGKYKVDNFGLTAATTPVATSQNLSYIGREVNDSGVPTGSVTPGDATDVLTVNNIVTDTGTCSMDNNLTSWLVDASQFSNILGQLVFGTNSVSLPAASLSHINNSFTYGNQLNLTLSLPASLSSTGLTGQISGTISNQAFTWTLDDSGTPASSVSLTRSGSLTEQLATTLGFDAIDLTLDTKLVQLASAQNSAPATFDGVMKLSIIPTAVQGDVGQLYDYNPSRFTLDGLFSNTTGVTVDAQLTLNMTNADTFQIYQTIVGSYTKTATVLTLNLGSIYKEYYTFNSGQVDFQYDNGSGLVSGGTYAGPYTDLDDFITQIIRTTSPSMALSEITDVGIYQTDLDIAYGSSGYLYGTLDLADANIDNSWGEHINNWRALAMTIIYLENLPNLPQARVTATGSRTGLDTGEASVTLEYDAVTITASANYDALNGVLAPRLYVVDNSDASAPAAMTIELDISGLQATGTITVNGVTVGNITGEFGGALIGTFIDGSFMSIGF